MQALPRYLRAVAMDDVTRQYQPLLAYWLIELALMLRWYRTSRVDSIPEAFRDTDFLTLTGIMLPALNNGGRDDSFRVQSSEAAFEAILKKRLDEIGEEQLNEDVRLFSNIELLGRLLELSDPEKAVMTFAVILNQCSIFRNVIAARNTYTTTQELVQIIARLTGRSRYEIGTSFHNDSPLVTCGLIRVNQCDGAIEEKLGLSPDIGNLMTQPLPGEEALAHKILKPADMPTYTLSVFPHMSRDIELLQGYLGNAMKNHVKGINILLYGPPGTCKSDFTKAIAHSLGIKLLEIPSTDKNGYPLGDYRRLCNFNFSQKLLQGEQNVLLMFDKADDALGIPRDSFFTNKYAYTQPFDNDSLSMFQTLKCNIIPTVWIVDVPHFEIDDLLSFDCSVMFQNPPQEARLNIAHHLFNALDPSNEWLSKIAARQHITPEQIRLAAKVARIASNNDDSRACILVDQMLDSIETLFSENHAPIRSRVRSNFGNLSINLDANEAQRKTVVDVLCNSGWNRNDIPAFLRRPQ